jgi:antitoxin (DNA-binding transcriptional repressor) of toxin-antitoxin stability system
MLFEPSLMRKSVVRIVAERTLERDQCTWLVVGFTPLKEITKLAHTLFNGRKIWHIAAMITVTLEKAQQELPSLIKRVLAGEEIVIGSRETAVRLTPVTTAPYRQDVGSTLKSYRGRGALKGQLVVGPEFFDPLSDEECGSN